MFKRTKNSLFCAVVAAAVVIGGCSKTDVQESKPAVVGARCDAPAVLQEAIKIAGGDFGPKLFELAGPETVSSLEGTRQCRGLVRLKQVFDDDPEYTKKVRTAYQADVDQRNLIEPFEHNGVAIEYTASPDKQGFFVKVRMEPIEITTMHIFGNAYGDRAAFAKGQAYDAAHKKDAKAADAQERLAAVGTPATPVAQALPPACAQYVTLYRVCTPNMISYLELANPAGADKLKQTHVPEDLARTYQAEIEKHGMPLVAQSCASQKMKDQVLAPFINDVIVPLTAAGALQADCAQAYAAFR